MAYVRLGEAAKALGVSASTVRNWCDVGIIRDFLETPGGGKRRIGERRIAQSEIDRLLAQMRGEHAPAED
jgi:predicted site-specific integrase-resolvase